MSQTFEVNYQSWRRLFLFCLGLAGAAAFCMKWMEPDFWVADEKFTIVGLELFYPSQKMEWLLGNMSEPVKMILRYHLYFDFAFMAGVYPGILALCMMARERRSAKAIKKLLLLLAIAQLPAWGFDVAENIYLLNWVDKPAIGNSLGMFHLIVALKWILALLGALAGILFHLRRSQPAITR